jgi:glycine betaine/proline transport system ATP-binding protein
VKIRVEGVSKVFGRDPKGALAKVRGGMDKARLKDETDHVLGLHDISLDIRAGETFVIMGLSGSGKSTLIRHFNRLIEPTGGRILFDGEDILAYDAERLQAFRRRKMAMVFQRFALLPHKTVAENVAYGLLLDGVQKAEALRRAGEQIALVGLTGFENSYPAQLSGGMQQRVGLARALATDAEVLLMDEAFSALDPLIRHDMQVQLKELQARLGKTIVFITHDLDEALMLGDHIAILKDGMLRQVGTGADILARPADDYVARFVRDVNRGRILLCGAFAEAGLIPAADAPVIEAGATLEAAFASFAGGATAVAVRGEDGRIAGALTAQRVMEALARI